MIAEAEGLAESGPLDARLVETIRQLGIPPRPAILEKVTAEMKREEPDFRALAKAIGADVGISGSLIKLVNSPYFGFRQKARTVQEALCMLGLSAVSSTIAAIALRQVLPTSPKLERFWDASARVAQMSGWLVQQLGVRDGVRPEDAYTFSLFRDCGIPIMLRWFPEYLETLASANGNAGHVFTEVEEWRHPTNHAMVGCLLGQSWWLAESTCVAIRHHHDFISLQAGGGAFSPAARRLICLAEAAEKLLQEATGMSQTREWEKMGTSCLSILDITPEYFKSLEGPAKALVENDGGF